MFRTEAGNDKRTDFKYYKEQIFIFIYEKLSARPTSPNQYFRKGTFLFLEGVNKLKKTTMTQLGLTARRIGAVTFYGTWPVCLVRPRTFQRLLKCLVKECVVKILVQFNVRHKQRVSACNIRSVLEWFSVTFCSNKANRYRNH